MAIDNLFIAAIGASAGGHEALKSFFSNLPERTGVAFVVVTHLLRDHPSILDRILSRFTSMQVRRMKGHDIVQPDNVYVMPENVKAFIRDGCLILRPREESESLNKTVDYFFHSLAEDQREKAIGIIFSGMGSDGFEGVKSIHEFGGTVLVQDPKSTLFKSMPDTIIKRDNPDVVMPPDELARNFLSIIQEKKVVLERRSGN